MSDVDRRTRHENILRAEISEVLEVFSKAASGEDIAFSIARAVCNLTRSRSVVYVAALNGKDESSPLTIGTYGSSAMFVDYEYWKASSSNAMTFGTFSSIASKFGWNDLDSSFVSEYDARISDGAKLYCQHIVDVFGIFSGYLCIESSFNPFEFLGFDDALLVMSIGALRFFQAQGKFGSHTVILQKIIHDINGSLAVVALQAELLRLKSNIENHFVEASERIQSALSKADNGVRRLNEFSNLFYPELQTADEKGNYSFPSIAISAAIASYGLTADQLAKMHLNISVQDNERVRVNGVVLYWIFRGMLGAWANPYLGTDDKDVEVFVDLRKTEEEPRFINLSISRKLGIAIDSFIDLSEDLAYGAVENKVVLFTPIVIMERIVKLFGGKSSVATVGNARVMTLGFPCIVE